MPAPAPTFDESQIDTAFSFNQIKDNGLSFFSNKSIFPIQVSNRTFSFSNQYIDVSDHSSLPPKFSNNGNKLFIPKGTTSIPAFTILPEGNRRDYPELRNSVLFLNGASGYHITIWGTGNFIYIDPTSSLPRAKISCGGSVLFIGPRVRSTSSALFSARNGGHIVLRTDILLASDVQFYTDDMHAILDTRSGQRINPYGGRIEVANHVWFGRRAEIYGDSVIGDNVIVGTNSFIRNKYIPSFTTCAGFPVKIIRENTTWHPADLESGDDTYQQYLEMLGDRPPVSA